MQLSLLKFFLFCLLLGLSNCLSAQIKFTSTISPGTIGKGEVAELKLMVENANEVQEINPPSLKDFIVVSGPNQESGMESINGNTRQYTGYTYVLKPKSKGNFTIAPASAKADGKNLTSNSVKIKVVNEATGNSANTNSPFSSLMPFDQPVQETNFKDFVLKKGESIQDKIDKNIFVRVEANKTACYVGEPILVTCKLYTRLNSESNNFKSPAFNGFSVIDLTTQNNNNYVLEKLNGRQYNVYTLRKVQLYPLQQGALDLESASVENSVRFIKEDYLTSNETSDPFGYLYRKVIPLEAILDEKVTLRSKPIRIDVKPLPVLNRPSSFNGAVGNFTISAQVEKNKFKTDDAGKLNIVISGEGNLALMNAPEISWPAGIEGYDPSVKNELNRLSVPISGEKVYDYPFTVVKEGSYTLPPIEYSFFDPATGKYKTISTTPLPITALKGSGKKPVLPRSVENNNRSENFWTSFVSKNQFIIVALFLLVLTGFLFWFTARKKKEKQVSFDIIQQIKKDQPAEESLLFLKPLQRTEASLMNNDTVQFYEALNKELHVFLANKLQLTAATMNKQNLAEALMNDGVTVAESNSIQQLLDDVCLQLYTPFADQAQMQQFYDRAINVVESFEKTRV
jgi:hypothetical protein